MARNPQRLPAPRSWRTDTLESDSVSTELLGDGRHYAGAYDGLDPDTRLDTALAAAEAGETVYLEAATYDAARTVAVAVKVVGTNISGTSIDAAWTFSENLSRLESVRLNSPLTITANGFVGTDLWISGTSVSAEGNGHVFTKCRNGEITFTSGTTNGLADGNYAGITITDNGTNTVGDNG
jgi:hypothetical protein